MSVIEQRHGCNFAEGAEIDEGLGGERELRAGESAFVQEEKVCVPMQWR